MCVIDSLRTSFLNHKGGTRKNHLYYASTQFQIIQLPKGPISLYTWPFSIICVRHDRLLVIKVSNSLKTH